MSTLTENTLLCSAIASELGELHSARNAHTLGVGVVTATRALAAILSAHPQYTRIVFVGTAGNNGADLNLGDCVHCTKFTLVDAGQLYKHSYIPDLMQSRIETAPAWNGSDLRTAHCLTPLGMTCTDEHAALQHEHYGPHVENLECYALAELCHARSLPFSAVLGITNTVGASGHEEWKANHVEVGGKLATTVRTAL